MMKTNLLYLKIGIPLLLFNFSAMASEDTKRFPGSLCQARNSSDLVSYGDNGSPKNESSAVQTWICPIVRDDVGDGDDPEYAEVSVTSGVSCLFWASSKSAGSPSITSSSTVGPTLTYALGDANIANNHTDGYYHFVCTVPPGGRVYSYRIDENQGES
jgi:hypothetical protein